MSKDKNNCWGFVCLGFFSFTVGRIFIKGDLQFQTKQANCVCTATFFLTNFSCFQRKRGGEGYMKMKGKFTPMVSFGKLKSTKKTWSKTYYQKLEWLYVSGEGEKCNITSKENSNTIENGAGCPWGDGMISSELVGNYCMDIWTMGHICVETKQTFAVLHSDTSRVEFVHKHQQTKWQTCC